MKPLIVALLLALVSVVRADVPASTTDAGSVCHPDRLRCEYLVNPLGLDVVQPRFDWILTAPGKTPRNLSQASYHLLVASSPEILAQDKGDLWDSGEVKSDETSQIAYTGSELKSREACFWKVQITDSLSKVSAWSAPASWEMGLLARADWQAKWISAPLIAQPPQSGAVSVVSASYEAIDDAGAKDVTAIVAQKFKDNALLVDNDTLSGDPALKHRKQLRIVYTIGGKKAEAIVNEKNTLMLSELTESLPLLRKDFTLTKPIVKARVYATALGLYELRLNGQRVGDHTFAPDWTNYNKRVRYQEYDVTALVKSGDNTLGAMVANGWYCGHIGNGGFQAWGITPAFFAQLEVTYSDGTVEEVGTDASWLKHAGPIIASDFMLGENYNAQLEIAGWDQPGLDTTSWAHVDELTYPVAELDGQVDQPVREIMELHPKAMKEIAPHRWIFDLGQNMVGVVRLKVSAAAGTRLKLRHAEMLNPDGTLYTENLRGAPSVDTYLCKGGGVETWQPRFTFHGFRYIELTGLTKKPAKDAVTGIVIGTDIPPTGKFACSNAAINQLQSNIQWGMRGNYLSVPTDCPQRDERMGWMGDAQVFIRTAAYNGDIAAFFTKWLVDVDDDQLPDGEFTSVSPAPTSKWIHGGGPAWADAGVICPWTIYLMYGDKRILQQHLPAMKRWVDWCQANSKDLIRDGPDHGYGDWLSQGEDTPKDLIGTAFFAYSTSLVAKACEVTGDPDAVKYQQLFGQIKDAFNKKYVGPDGKITGDTQAGYDMALRFGLLSNDERPKAADFLEQDVKAHNDHLTTGFVGVSYLLPALTAQNKIDTAYRVFQQDTFPSWLFSVKQGATTVWERWDGWTPEKGFQNPGMNSFNHYSLGSCGEWMFDTVAGIGVDPDQPGFRHILIHPRPGGGLTHAEGSFDSIHGKISTKWTLKNHVFTLDLTIPINTTASFEIPTSDLASLKESGAPVPIFANTEPAKGEHIVANLMLGSGDYHYTCNVP